MTGSKFSRVRQETETVRIDERDRSAAPEPYLRQTAAVADAY